MVNDETACGINISTTLVLYSIDFLAFIHK